MTNVLEATGLSVALFGPNGAGRTTLLNSVLGILRPDAGRILFNGIDVGGNHPDSHQTAGQCRGYNTRWRGKPLGTQSRIGVSWRDKVSSNTPPGGSPRR